MQIIKKITNWLVKEKKYWFVFLLVFGFIEIVNYGILKHFIPEGICFWISALSILLISTYLFFMSQHIYGIINAFLDEKHTIIRNDIDLLKKHIDEIDNKNENLLKQLLADISENANEQAEHIIKDLKSTIDTNKRDLSNEIIHLESSVQKKIDEQSNNNIKLADNSLQAQQKSTGRIISEIEKANKNSEINLRATLEKTENYFDAIASKFEAIAEKEENAMQMSFERINAVLSMNNESTYNAITDNKNAINAMHEQLSEKTDVIFDKEISLINELFEKTQQTHEDFVTSMEAARIISHAEHTEILELGNGIIREAAQSETELRNQIDGIIKELHENNEVSIKSIEEIRGALTEKIVEISTNYARSKEEIELIIEQFKMSASQMHSLTLKKLDEILDNNGNDFEKQEKRIALLDRQIVEFSKKSNDSQKNILNLADIIQNDLVQRSEQILENQNAWGKDYEEKQKKIAEKNEINLDKQFNGCLEKLVLVQNEISNIENVAIILKSINALLENQTKLDMSEKGENKIEEYKDVESGDIVKNHFKKDKLDFSEIISDGKKVYEIYYDSDGKRKESRNYNKNGDIITELKFNKNEQVILRTETITDNGKPKKVVSKFDEKGNKIE